MAGTIRATSPRALARMELKKSAFDEITVAVADGIFAALQGVIERAAPNAPDSPYDPYPAGEGLPKQGGVLVYIANEKTHGWSIRGDQPKKPKAARTATKEHSVVGLAGFGFPARFAEGGTIRQPARPFFGPQVAQDTARIAADIAAVTKPRINGGGA